MSARHLPPAAIEYPEWDGKPMAENDAQARAIVYAFGALLLRYRECADVHVSADLLSHAVEHAAHQEAHAARRAALARAEAAEARAAELEARLAELR